MVAELAERVGTRVMSCDATIVVVGAQVDPRVGLARLHELEHRWSRFLADSDVSILNRAGGRPVVVSEDTVTLVEAAVGAWHRTGGAFDPTLLGALVALGYDTSRDDLTRRTVLRADIHAQGRPGSILVDREASVVRLPEGTTFDPGGIGKGLAADLVCDELLAAGATGVLVEVGGDLRVGGGGPEGPWAITVDHGSGRGVPPTVALAAGGVATSTSAKRVWDCGGLTHHHLIDPATLQPSRGVVMACSVVAGSAATAEGFTKVAFTRSPEAAVEVFDSVGLAALVTTVDGATHRSAAWREFQR